MAPSAQQLPAEVWHHVFGYLSTEDKFSVRASCKHFEKLIDHASLWKDWSVVLGFQNYNSRFWETLRRRRVSNVVVRSSIKGKDWRHLAQLLPHISTLVINLDTQFSLPDLYEFRNLRRLALRSSGFPLTEKTLEVRDPQQVTHLSLCYVTFTPQSTGGFIDVVSRLTSLTSLVLHQIPAIEQPPISIVQSILTCLPKLKHLSLSVLASHNLFGRGGSHIQRPSEEAHAAAGTHPLSSLELVGCMYPNLPEDAMRLVPCLRSLSVFHKKDEWFRTESHLKSWLRDLPHLCTLVIVNSLQALRDVSYIPPSVTSLRLCGSISPNEIAVLARQLPNLLHLHIDSFPSNLRDSVAQIPQLFPKLKSLKIRLEHVPEESYLSLLQLQDLEYLEILDDHPHNLKIISKLRALATCRLHIASSPRQKDVLSCPWFCNMH